MICDATPMWHAATRRLLSTGHVARYLGDHLVPSPRRREVAYTVYDPAGVIVAISPWNFPLMLATWKIAPAIACGNTCVLKPAETTPLTALMLAEILQECGLPDGVVNIVTGGPDAGRAITALAGAKNGVDKIAFTGSTEVGKAIAKAVAGTGVKLTLELGGKSPNIVFADADIERFAAESPYSVFDNCGQDCDDHDARGAQGLQYRDRCLGR